MAIATTYTKRQEQLANGQTPVKSNNAYNGMKGVSENTANNLGNYQAGYKPSEQAQQAKQYLQNVQAQKPQSYNSKYAPQLDNILQQIQNPQQFKYEFNGDNLFKYYADLYSQNGKQAAMDTLGQASALTGGYGNSYGQQVAQQQYAEYMRPLYDMGLQLQDRAYQQYQDQLANRQNAYQMTADAENRDYGMYRDLVGDWMGERDYAAGRADTERNFDYNEYANNLDYWNRLAGDEAQLAETQRQYDTNLAVNYATAILANGQMPSMELLQAAGLSPEDAAKLIAQLHGGGGGGSGKDPVKLLREALGQAALGSAKGLLQGAIPGAAALAAAGNILPESLQGFANGWAGAEDIPDQNRTVDVVTERQYMPGTTSKEKTTTMTQQQYDRMIEEQLKKEMKQKK